MLQPPGDTALHQPAQNMLRSVHMCSLLEWYVEDQRLLLGKNYNKVVGWVLSFVQACYSVP